MAQFDSAGRPAKLRKHALRTNEEEHGVEAAKKQQESPRPKRNEANAYVPGENLVPHLH